jgi:hypothetical protein
LDPSGWCVTSSALCGVLGVYSSIVLVTP